MICPECGTRRTAKQIINDNERANCPPADAMRLFRQVGCAALFKEAPCAIKWKEI
jgi:predicted nucleic acid-binding Zn ribbon protein